MYELWKEFTNDDKDESATSTAPTQVSNNQSNVVNDIVQPFNYGGNNNSPSRMQQNQSNYSPTGGQDTYNLPKGKSISSNEAIDYLVKKGMTPAQAAGVVGNLLQESTLNSGAQLLSSIYN